LKDWDRTGGTGLERSAGLGGTGFTAPFFTRLFVMLTGLEDLQDPFALDLFLEALKGFLKRLVLTDINF